MERMGKVPLEQTLLGQALFTCVALGGEAS